MVDLLLARALDAVAISRSDVRLLRGTRERCRKTRADVKRMAESCVNSAGSAKAETLTAEANSAELRKDNMPKRSSEGGSPG